MASFQNDLGAVIFPPMDDSEVTKPLHPSPIHAESLVFSFTQNMKRYKLYIPFNKGVPCMTTTEQNSTTPTVAAEQSAVPAKTAAKPEAKVATSKPAKKDIVKAVAKPAKKVAAKPAAKAPTKAAPQAVAKPAPKAAAKPAAKPVAAKVATKPAAKAAKPVAKPVTKPAAKPAAKASAPKVEKAKKPKMVRDSFTIPKNEYDVLDVLKMRAAKLGSPVKKTELIRAGMKAIAALSDAAFKTALSAVPSLKTGRPAKGKKA
jgi:hypothetical protein